MACLLQFAVLVVCCLVVAGTHLNNGLLGVNFTTSGQMTRLSSKSHQPVGFSSDAWSAVVSQGHNSAHTLSPQVCKVVGHHDYAPVSWGLRYGMVAPRHVAVNPSPEGPPTSISFVFECSAPFLVVVSYHLMARWNFVQKDIAMCAVASANRSLCDTTANFTVHWVSEWSGLQLQDRFGLFERPVLGDNPWLANGLISAFFRRPSTSDSLFVSVKNPFFELPSTSLLVVTVNTTLDVAHTGQLDGTWFVSDGAVLGLASLSSVYLPGGVNLGERRAFTACVSFFLMDSAVRSDHSIKLDCAWDLNDYQLDMAHNTSRVEYDRVLQRARQLGLTHLIFEPRDTLQSSRHNATDDWGWEETLWFSLGEKLRQQQWHPAGDPVPQETQTMLEFAASQNIKLMAYVYPILGFHGSHDNSWLYKYKDGRLRADLSCPYFQRYLYRTLDAFMNATGAGGFAWDYTFFSAPNKTNEYSQWRGWMNVIESLRRSHPDIVMDHRQLNHQYGPWYQLAGSYAEPLAGDENPETYGILFAGLSTDHNTADKLRTVSNVYRSRQLMPNMRIPGFASHQTERSMDNHTGLAWSDYNTRDFDYLGFPYSLLSNVAAAGQNLVLAMPARDTEEFRKLPLRYIDFVNHWVNFTDVNMKFLINTQPLQGMESPTQDRVDGTAAMYEDEGYVFLFNPNYVPQTAWLVVGEGMGITNGSRQSQWLLSEIYPRAPTVISVVNHGEVLPISVHGLGVVVLRLTMLPCATLPLVLNISYANVTYSATEGTLHVWGAKAFAGTSLSVQIQLPAGEHLTSFQINDSPVFPVKAVPTPCARPVVPSAVCVNAILQTAGVVVANAQPAAALAPADFYRGWFNTTMCIQQAYLDQLADVRADYPIDWQPHDYDASWLVPGRLLLHPHFVLPQYGATTPMLVLDGQAVPLTAAFTSRGVHSSDTFTGWYTDVSKLSVGIHSVSLWVPPSKTLFKGLFFHTLTRAFSTNFKVESWVDSY